MSYRNTPAWMWADALELLRRAERLQRQSFRPETSAESRTVWEPPVDLVESETEIKVAVALPGVSPEHLSVSFESGVLAVDAVRPLRLLAGQNMIHRLEIPYGRFERRIGLPPGRYELIEQAFSHGCLHIRLRKYD